MKVDLEKKKKRLRKRNLPLKAYEVAIKKYDGYVSDIAKALNVSHQAVYQRINASKKLKQIIEEIDDKITDQCEKALKRQIDADNMTAVIFHLKTKGKKRGYSERVENELSTKDDKPLPVKVVIVESARNKDTGKT